jgi:hypothetical protein
VDAADVVQQANKDRTGSGQFEGSRFGLQGGGGKGDKAETSRADQRFRFRGRSREAEAAMVICALQKDIAQ